MKVHQSIESLQRLEHAVVSSGTFDGVHVGHQKILSRIREVAENQKGESVLLTFWPHPRLVLFPDQELKLLNTFEEKLELLEKQGIDHLVRIPFTRAFSQMSSLEFIESILVEKLGTKTLVIGYDHRFGRNREGSFENLKRNAIKYGFNVEEIPRQDVDHVGVSSTKIRKALSEGKVEVASEYLGRRYSLQGEVVEGDKIGRQMGFPTANINVGFPHKLIPHDGIYAVRVGWAGKTYGGMLYIGSRPTLSVSGQNIEVNIFDFDHKIYGEQLTVHFIQQIRNDSKFDNLEELRQQLIRDKEKASEILNLI